MEIENTKFKFNPNQTIYESTGLKDSNEIVNALGGKNWYSLSTYSGGDRTTKMNKVFVEIINSALMKINKECDFAFAFHYGFNVPYPCAILNINNDEYKIIEEDGKITHFGEDQDDPYIRIINEGKQSFIKLQNYRSFGDYEWHESDIEFFSNKIKDYVLSESK